MNPFRRNREFALYRQLVFGPRAGAPERNDLDFPPRDPREPHSTQAHGESRNDETPGDAATETA